MIWLWCKQRANLLEKLKICKSIQQVHQIHAQIITRGLLSLHSSLLLTNILHSFTSFLPIHGHHPSTSINYAVSLFHTIPRPCTFSYNSIVRAHTLLSSPLHALLYFTQMRRLSLPPDSHTFPFALKACSQLSSLPLAATLHSQAFKFGFLSDVFVSNSLIHVYSVSGRIHDAHQMFDESSFRDVVSYNALIDAYVKAGETGYARELFDKMPVRDAVSWGTLIAGYAQADLSIQAIELFDQIIQSPVRPDNIALVSALSACAKLGELEKGKQIHCYIEQNRIRMDIYLSTALVDFYAKCGFIESARELFESTQEKNLFTWNAMLMGLAMHGYGSQLLDYLSRMAKAGVKPDGVTFLGVLVGCSHAGLIDVARQLFREMEGVYKVSRELKHYGCMADLLGRAGLIKEAMVMIEKMPEDGDVFVWGALLGGCRIHGYVEVAEKVAERVMELNPDQGGVYALLANMYANAERWEDLAKIRRLRDSRKVYKSAGCSAIQLNGVYT